MRWIATWHCSACAALPRARRTWSAGSAPNRHSAATLPDRRAAKFEHVLNTRLRTRSEGIRKGIMLEHLNPTPQKPSRVVVLGAYGFVGGTCARLLGARGVPVLPLDKDDIDLMASGAAEQLQTRLAPDEALLVVFARAPCKGTGMMVHNLRIRHAVCTALERSSVNHVVYFSSDAVYSDAPVPLTEESRTEPGSMHGTMHLARELMLKATVKAPLAVVRSTLIYGEGDPHNG